MSVCRKQIIEVTTLPQRQTLKIKDSIPNEHLTKDSTTKIPKAPSLRRTPARAIEPASGASTWALGSHRWTGYIGILTKKPTIINSQTVLLKKRDL